MTVAVVWNNALQWVLNLDNWTWIGHPKSPTEGDIPDRIKRFYYADLLSRCLKSCSVCSD